MECLEGIMKKIIIPDKVVFLSDLRVLSSVSQLEKVGAGHDGIIFRYNDKALKILKYDINLRKQKDLMTFDKNLYFQNELKLKRILNSKDILLDFDGVYCGYVMEYLPKCQKEDTGGDKKPGEFLCGDLLTSSFELMEDFNELTKKQVVAKDINRGSYLYTDDFLHLCDMDKYLRLDGSTTLSVSDANIKMCNFVISKFLYYEMQNVSVLDKTECKQLNNWVKKSSNSRTFMKDLEQDLANCANEPISEYALSKVKKIVR